MYNKSGCNMPMHALSLLYIDYYSEHLKADLMSGPLSAFNAARLFSPLNIQKTKPECTALSSLLASSFITESLLAALKEEFPQYVALAEDVSPDYNIIRFWKTYSDAIPNWGKAASKVFLAQPTSAAAERVFSIMNNTFGDQQNSSLEDYVEASVIMQYNKDH